jgi:hypothetical protein|tara:strand:+ start:2060 stop:3385 length:1326 start_codon:yes stop_codon:yes gene_type:complete
LLEGREICNPDFTLDTPTINTQPSGEKDKKSVHVFFDGSLSMQGFVTNQPGQKNLFVNVIDDLQQIAENVGNKTYYYRFGKTIKAMKEHEVVRVIKPSFYKCPAAATDCVLDNQETRLDLPFKATKIDEEATYIIVTDLFIENKQLVGGKLQQITKPLKGILKRGQSIGIIGVMNSFNGTIYGIPLSTGGTGSYSGAQLRPFYILVIGDQKNVNRIKKNLEEQHFIDPEDKYKFSLITSTPVSQNLNVNKNLTEDNIIKISKAENFKFTYVDSNLPLYQFDTDKKRKIKFKIKNSEIIVSGSTGVSKYKIDDNLWSSNEVKCKKILKNETWRSGKKENRSKWKQTDKELVVSILDLKKLLRGFRYFYLVNVYAEKPGNLSEETFKDWSVSDPDAEALKDQNPVEFKTLNLTKIIKILNSVANESFKPTLIASIALDFNLTK